MKNFTLLICCLLTPLFMFAQEMGSQKQAKKQQQMETQQSDVEMGNEEDMMEKWMELIALGDEHKAMAEDVGTYSYVMTFWTHPGAEPAESKGTATIEAIMEGRYLVEKHNGEAMGMPFHGMSINGYDKLEKVYVSTWIDNLGTGIMKFTGQRNTEGELVSTTTAVNPMTGQREEHRVVTKNNADGWTMDYYVAGAPGAKEFQSMHVEYMRED